MLFVDNDEQLCVAFCCGNYKTCIALMSHDMNPATWLGSVLVLSAIGSSWCTLVGRPIEKPQTYAEPWLHRFAGILSELVARGTQMRPHGSRPIAIGLMSPVCRSEVYSLTKCVISGTTCFPCFVFEIDLETLPGVFPYKMHHLTAAFYTVFIGLLYGYIRV